MLKVVLRSFFRFRKRDAINSNPDLLVLQRHLHETVLAQTLRSSPVPRRRRLRIGFAQLLGLILGRHFAPLEEQRGASRAGLCSATAGLAGPAPASAYTVTDIGSRPAASGPQDPSDRARR